MRMTLWEAGTANDELGPENQVFLIGAQTMDNAMAAGRKCVKHTEAAVVRLKIIGKIENWPAGKDGKL